MSSSRTLLALALMACAPASPVEPRRPPTPPPSASAAPSVSPPAATYAKTSTTKVASLDDHVWPPPPVGDEPWVAFERPWLHTLEGAPPTFYTTSVRPDPARKVRVQIVAIDARQIELDMAIGKEGPYPPDEKTNGKWPKTGGKLPRDPAIATRVVAAFNGAFRLDQHAHGMVIRRRTFAPPLEHVASLLMHDDGRLGFGNWGPKMTAPPDVRSLRQNLDPLLDDGEVDPRKRPRWGGILKKPNQVGQRAKRSGICRTPGGHFFYLWGDAIEAADLGVAMKQAGCEYGIHLDMNVIHVGFVFMSFNDAQYKAGKSEALSPAMGITDKKYVETPNPKEFFYVTLRAPDPAWKPDGFVQPAPAWMPSVRTRMDGDVRLTLVDGRRVRFAATDAGALGAADVDRVLGAIELGTDAVGVEDGRLLVAAGAAVATTALGVTASHDLVIAESTTPTDLVEVLHRAGAVHAVAVRGKLERAGRDAIASGGSGKRLYILAASPPAATYRFDRDADGAPRWPAVKTPVK